MNIRHPELNLRLALASALVTDLDVVDDALAPDGARPRRPREDECNVVLFGQFWPAPLLGVTARVGMVEADTVVVCGPAGDACVYAAGRLLYLRGASEPALLPGPRRAVHGPARGAGRLRRPRQRRLGGRGLRARRGACAPVRRGTCTAARC